MSIARTLPTFGDGRMGKLIADFDWSLTSLGPISSWSEALVTTVKLMLGQKQAICMF